MEDLNVKKIVGCLVREFGTSDDGGNLTRREMKLVNVVTSLLRSAQVDDVEIDEEDEVYMTKATDEDDWEEDLDSSNPYDGATLTEPCVRYDITDIFLCKFYCRFSNRLVPVSQVEKAAEFYTKPRNKKISTTTLHKNFRFIDPDSKHHLQKLRDFAAGGEEV